MEKTLEKKGKGPWQGKPIRWMKTHTPALAEEKALLIDQGGEVNFRLEGDNLAALKLPEKTHLGRIGLIYIAPPTTRETGISSITSAL